MGDGNRIYIVGAHSRAQTLAVYLQYLYPEITVEAFLYNNEEPNPTYIEKVPVVHMDNIELHTDWPVYIGTRGVYHKNITDYLRRLGFKTIYPVTVELDSFLRNGYLKKYFAGIGRKFMKIDDLAGKVNERKEDMSVAVYVVRSILDKPLQCPYKLAPYEKVIQAGAALTPKRFSDSMATDFDGDNISRKNRQFCELTALYWIWKNAKEDMVGLAHYRRHFILPQGWAGRMLQNQVDVILPTPLYVAPSVGENFKKRHDPLDWEYMMGYLRENNGQEYFEAEEFFKQNLYSPCNMFIMHKKVLDSLCEWMFPILFAAAKHGGEREDGYMNRYPGFLSERLMSFFFEKYRNEYKIIYADKNFLP